MNKPTWSVWICSGCRRRVPGNVIECRCGGLRAHAVGIVTSQPEARESPWPLALKALLLVAAVAGAYTWFVIAPRVVKARPVAPIATAENVPPPALPPVRRRPPPQEPFTMPAPHEVMVRTGPPPDFAPPPVPTALPQAESDPDRRSEPAAPRSIQTEADQARAAGRRRLAAEFAALKSNARRLIAQVKRYDAMSCEGQHTTECRALLEQLGATALEVGSAMERTEEIARTSWLDPGVVWDLRRQHGLDDALWDEIERLTREYRR